MNKHAFIYSEIPMYASVLGWILQQSDSYESNYFKFNKSWADNYIERNDPWDNHSDDPDNWSHAFIEDIEDKNLHTNFTWLDNFVDSFTCNTIFGLSYGAWKKSKPWLTTNNEIVIQPSSKMFDLFYEVYERRTVSPEQLLENIQMHVHDHKQDNKEYNEHMMNTIYPSALTYAEHGVLEFWQLQYSFQHGGDTVPSITEMESIKHKIKTDIFNDSFQTNSNTIVIEDLFDINLKELCKRLNIVYNDNIETEYNKFVKYANLLTGE
tara:strand:- start:481 stop:1278 length:798 start_codon:yes stop_codon:yes gene_type:complete